MNKIVNHHIDEIYKTIVDLVDGFYIVGGFVRDSQLNHVSYDVDISLNTSIENMSSIFGHLNSHLECTKLQYVYEFSNIKFNLGQYNFDLVPFRKESYDQNSNKPAIKNGTFIDDLLRRDFTVNSIYKKYIEHDQFEIIDPLNGLKDIDNRLLKLNYSGSFADDPTRMFRLFIYKHRLNFNLENKTLDEIDSSLMKKVPLNTLVGFLVKILREEKNESILNDIISHDLFYSIGLLNPCEIGGLINMEEKMLEILSKNSNMIKIFQELNIYSKIIKKL